MKLYNNVDMRSVIAHNNIEDARKYSVDIAVNKMVNVYKKFICNFMFYSIPCGKYSRYLVIHGGCF
jgi:hypothetical protein